MMLVSLVVEPNPLEMIPDFLKQVPGLAWIN
jgi:hypothetical protein